MEPAEIVGTADQIPTRSQHGRCMGDGPSPASQWRQGGAEGGVEPLDGRRIDPGATAGRRQHCRDGFGSPQHDTAFDADHAPLDVPLDQLA